MKDHTLATVYVLLKAFESIDQTLATTESFLYIRKIKIQVIDFIGKSFVPLNGLPQGAVLSPHRFVFT